MAGSSKVGVWCSGKGGRALHAASRENQNSTTLLPLARQWRCPATHVMPDGWAAYQHVEKLNDCVYLREVVVHQHTLC